MVLDSSAIIAILFGEAEAERLARTIETASVRLLSVANWVETSLVVLARKGAQGLSDLERFISDAAIDRVPVDLASGALAITAFRRFGRGRHPARPILAIASPMLLPRQPANRCCSRAAISR